MRSTTSSTPSLVYQTLGELTREIQSLPAESIEGMSPSDMISVFLRRQRLALMQGKEKHSSVLSRSSTTQAGPRHGQQQTLRRPSPPTCVLLVGDDGLSVERNKGHTREQHPNHEDDAVWLDETTKRRLARMLKEDPDAVGDNPRIFELDETTPADADAVWVLAPSFHKTDRALLLELFSWCDVVVGCYNAARPESVTALTDRWLPVRWQAMAQQRLDAQQVAAAQAAEGHVTVNGWLSMEAATLTAEEAPAPVAPLILVGLRDAASPVTSVLAGVRQHVEAVAEHEGAVRLVELYTDNQTQATLLRRHCALERDALYEDHPLSARDSFLIAKEAALRLLLRAPPPRVQHRELSAAGDCVTYSLQAQPSTSPQLRCWQRQENGVDPISLAPGAALTLPVSFTSGLCLFQTGRCFFPSQDTWVAPPPLSAVPCGYFNVAQREFQCGSLDTAQGPRTDATIGYAFTQRAQEVRDGTLVFRSLKASGVTGSLCIPLIPGEDPATTASEDKERLWRPWPSHLPDPPKHLVVKASYTASSAAPQAQVRKTMDTEDALTRIYEVPAVLPTPRVVYDDATHTLCLTPHPPPAHVELRYTLDGTEPTMTSSVYTGPIALHDRLPVRVVRAAAFPKAFLPSRAATFEIGAFGRQNTLSLRHGVGCTDNISSLVKPSVKKERCTRDAHSAETTLGHVDPSRVRRELPAPLTSPPSRKDPMELRGEPATTRAQRLRQAFHTGTYQPPYIPFLTGKREGEADTVTKSGPSWHTDASRSSSLRKDSASPATRILRLPVFEDPLCIAYVVVWMDTTYRSASPAAASISYVVEGRQGPSVRWTTLAWGELRWGVRSQTIVLPPEAARTGVTELRCRFTVAAPHGMEALMAVQDVRPIGDPLLE